MSLADCCVSCQPGRLTHGPLDHQAGYLGPEMSLLASLGYGAALGNSVQVACSETRMLRVLPGDTPWVEQIKLPLFELGTTLDSHAACQEMSSWWS